MMPETIDSSKQNMTLERLKSLYELIGRMNSVYNLDELLDFVVERALSLTGGRRGLLLLSDDHERKLQHIAKARGEGLGEQHMEQALNFVSTAVIKDVLELGEPRLINDLQSDERYENVTSFATLNFKRVRSVLAVPLKMESELVGLIYIDHPRRNIFGSHDLDFLSAFAAQAALAINRASQHQRQLDELTFLNELSRSVVQVLDLDQVLTRIVNEATRMLNVETGSVLLVDEATEELYFATSVSNGVRVDIPTRLRRDQGIAGWVVSQRKTVCVSNVAEDSRWFGEVEVDFITRSILAVPLELNDRVLGVLQVLNKKDPTGFNPTDVARLSAFSVSATIALENARLFQEARQVHQLRALNELALALSSTLDLNTILKTGLEKSLSLLGAQAGLIGWLTDHNQPDSWSIRVNYGLPQDPTLLEQQLNLIRQLTGQIFQNGHTGSLIIDRFRPEPALPNDALARAGIEAMILIPIAAGYQANGVLALLHTLPHLYHEEEISLLDNIAHIIFLAVQNAIHYDQLQNQANQLTYLNEVGSVLTRSLDLEHVLRVIIDGVNALLETERTSVFLIDSETNELVLRYSNEGDADIRLPAPWQGIAGWVAAHDVPALVNDTLRDPRHLRQIALETGYEAHSILCVPLKVEGQVIGVIEVLNKTGGEQFNHRHQTLLIELTKWAAIALHNARLFDERIQAYQHLATEQQRRINAETRGAMAAIVLDMAHTMNNIIGAIRVWALQLENVSLTSPQAVLSKYQAELHHIRQNAEEGLKLISTMTDPLKEVSLTPTDVHACLEAAIRSCWWPENIMFFKNFQADVPLVKANEERLEAVFHNLLSNAIQVLVEQGGVIQVSTRLTRAGQVEIAIADDGPGIPLHLQEHIFNPGVSGKAGGLGLGLWLVETFVHQFEGQVSFTSSADKGATFMVTLQPLNV